MTISTKQLDQQNRRFKELMENTDYQLVFDDGLLEELKIRLSIFDLAMQRTIASNFDPPTKEQRVALSENWFCLYQNLKAALELLRMAEHTARGLSYNAEEEGGFLSESLKQRFSMRSDDNSKGPELGRGSASTGNNL